MPTVNEYKNCRGFYIRASYRGRITTYQVSSDGERILLRCGCYDGTSISTADLRYLVNNGFAFTGHSGPGSIEEEVGISKPLPVALHEHDQERPTVVRQDPVKPESFNTNCEERHRDLFRLYKTERIWCAVCNSWIDKNSIRPKTEIQSISPSSITMSPSVDNAAEKPLTHGKQLTWTDITREGGRIEDEVGNQVSVWRSASPIRDQRTRMFQNEKMEACQEVTWLISLGVILAIIVLGIAAVACSLSNWSFR